MSKTSLRFRVDFSGICSVGFGKIALLEGIDRCGSLSQAARDMGMSYRRAWLLIESMNTGFEKPVVNSNIGGSGGGGAVVTDFGHQLIATFRSTELTLATLVENQMSEIARQVSKHRPSTKKKASALRRSVARKSSTARN
jgi:molybdate transport system regulatory protein